jgi:outer membrane receptor protein involved in Fe transport
MRKSYFLTLVFCLFFVHLFSQNGVVEGVVRDAETKEPLFSVTVHSGAEGTVTDFDGRYSLSLPAGAHNLEFTYVGYALYAANVRVEAGKTIVIDVLLEEQATLLQTATVTSGKFEKPLSEVTVSLEVIKPQLIQNVNTQSVDQVLEKVPGVNIIDGQANIRGGAGFSYGAGSRVLLLVDDIPILQPDAGFPNWNDVPVENIEQIEVVKGAASALYGSSALNGIINIRTGFAKNEPEFKAAIFHTFVGAPRDPAKKWWTNTPETQGASLSYKRRIGRLDLVMSAFSLREESHLERNFIDYQRATLGLRYRITDNLTIGMNSNFNGGQSQSFFFWFNADEGGMMGTRTAYSANIRLRYNVDPYITYFDPLGNRHKFMGRYFSADNQSDNNQANASQLQYGEYQFQRQFTGVNLVATAGLVGIQSAMQAELYGDTTYRSTNLAGYLQLDQKLFNRLNLSGGFRYEANRIINPGFSFFNGLYDVVIAPSDEREAKPVYRVGANLELTKYTFLRSSWGQGYRYPTVAEKFITTNFGGVPISPNPDLQSETGWSTEIGLKQGFRFWGFEGFFDAAAFWSEYDNMMEFTFVDVFPNGFQSQNVGGTIIKGFEVTLAGRGKVFGLPTSVLTGLTWIEPKFAEFDTTVILPNVPPTEGQINALGSSVDYNVLKYRNRRSFKFDMESTYKKFTAGVAIFAASDMENIDRVFELLVVPGLRQYRTENNSRYVHAGVRASYMLAEKAKLSFLVNNIFNAEYTLRPGLIEPPRNFSVRLDYSL